MKWINIDKDLPVIPNNCWRTEEPILLKNSKGDVMLSYFERIEDKKDGRYFGCDFLPKFVCEDKLSNYFGMVITDAVEWMHLPK